MFSIDFAVPTICEKYSLGNPLTAPEKIYSGLLHDVWRLRTDKGSYAIKVIVEDTLNPHVLSPTKAEEIALLMQQKGVSTVAALSPYCFKLDDAHKVVVMPWVMGDGLAIKEIDTNKAKKVGNLLGKIHLADLSYPELQQELFQGLDEKNWRKLIQEIADSSFKEDLTSKLPNLIEWSNLAQKALTESDNQVVVSHRDFDVKNVLWSKNSPILLDWEYAGLINPSLDLLIVALNWSGVQYGFFNQENFDAVLAGFSELTILPELSTNTYYLYFGYCLDWLVFCLKRCLVTKDVRYRQEVLNTYRAIQIVAGAF